MDISPEALQAEMDRRIAVVEREARSLTEHLTLLMEAGDDRLREHIANQIRQVDTALEAAEKLEVQRVGGVHRELLAALESAALAVSKAEAANHERFLSHNGLLEQMRDQAERSGRTIQAHTATFLPREVADAQYRELAKQLSTNTDRIITLEGARGAGRMVVEERRTAGTIRREQIWVVVGVVGVIISLVSTTVLIAHLLGG